MMTSHAEIATQLFFKGYNCAQSVVGAWADRYGLDMDTALRISSSFGGGIGRMRLTCGAASGNRTRIASLGSWSSTTELWLRQR